VENDPEALAKGIDKLLADPQRIKRLSNNALKKAGTFDVNQLSTQLLGVYEQAIQDKKQNQFVTLNKEETVASETVSPVET
jgi:glycosyltransferase involved in cell wall biosynthesis